MKYFKHAVKVFIALALIAAGVMLLKSGKDVPLGVEDDALVLPPMRTAQMKKEFKDLNFDAFKAAENKIPVPRIFSVSIPKDFNRSQFDDDRKALFYNILMPAVLRVNAEVEQERSRLMSFEREFSRTNKLPPAYIEEAHRIGLGAQFGGKYYAHDVRIIRLPRHGASCPVGLGVSCSADRNIKCKINKDGIWIEKLDSNPGELIPEELRQAGEGNAVKIDLNRPMAEILKELSKYPVATRLSLNGTIIVGRDIAHAKLKERLDRGEDLPQYIKDHPIYYAGPAKTPQGMACGSMGPTTAGRMDPYVDLFQSHGGSLIMLAKGNRSQAVTDACKKHGGFYLGSIGGPAAILAQNNIKSIECVEYPELGMEAIWKIEVEDFPAFILVDDKGNDFFKQIKPRPLCAAQK